MPSKRVPSYLEHKPSGQALVVLGGKHRYLGKYGTPESIRRYDELIAQWLQKSEVWVEDRKVIEILAHFW